jgi:hypothetical protein
MERLERTESFNPAKISRDGVKIERTKNDHSHLHHRPMAQLVGRSGTARLEPGLGRSVYREFIGNASGNTLKLTGTF